jgi:hypothetical protein
MITLQHSKTDGFYFNVKLEINLKPAAFYDWIDKVSFLLRKNRNAAKRNIGRLADCADGRRYITHSARDQVPLELALLTACAESLPSLRPALSRKDA